MNEAHGAQGVGLGCQPWSHPHPALAPAGFGYFPPAPGQTLSGRQMVLFSWGSDTPEGPLPGGGGAPHGPTLTSGLHCGDPARPRPRS